MVEPEAFRSVREILGSADRDDFIRRDNGTFPMKNGIHLRGVIPVSLVNRPLLGQDRLCMEFLQIDGNRQIIAVTNLGTHNWGLGSTYGEGDYADQQLVVIFYQKPGTELPEINPRQIKVIDIHFGIHKNHPGEDSDFYLVGEDTQYRDKPIEQRGRVFPFRRIGLKMDS